MPASGFQSFQFRQLEVSLGLKRENRISYTQCAYSGVFSQKEQDILHQIEARRSKLSRNRNLDAFFAESFDPVLNKLIGNTEYRWEEAAENICLIPADLSFGNAIKSGNGTIKIIDFEYFGKGHPIKLACDFVWHPAHKLTDLQIKIFRENYFNYFSSIWNLEKNFDLAMPFYGLRWGLIILNIFLDAATPNSPSHDIQLAKAENICKAVAALIEQN